MKVDYFHRIGKVEKSNFIHAINLAKETFSKIKLSLVIFKEIFFIPPYDKKYLEVGEDTII